MLWALWNELGLRTLLARVLPAGHQEVSLADVIFVLVAQRCLTPGSKLSAEHRVPTTALLELMGVAPGALNNVRIHRVPEALGDASERLQEELARWAHARWGAGLGLGAGDHRCIFRSEPRCVGRMDGSMPGGVPRP